MQSAAYSFGAAWRESFLWFDIEAQENWKYYPENPSGRALGKETKEKNVKVLPKTFVVAKGSFKCAVLLHF